MITQAIASELNIRVNTVKYHKKQIYKSLNIASVNNIGYAVFHLT